VTGMTSLERYNDHQRMAMAPNSLNIGDPRLLQVIPDAGRVERYTVALRNRKQRRVAEQNRIVAVENPFDANDALLAAMGLISRPLAERSFHDRLFFWWRYLPFDNAFGGCRNRKTSKRRTDDFHRFAAQRASIVVLAHSRLSNHGVAVQVAGSHPNTTATASMKALRSEKAMEIVSEPSGMSGTDYGSALVSCFVATVHHERVQVRRRDPAPILVVELNGFFLQLPFPQFVHEAGLVDRFLPAFFQLGGELRNKFSGCGFGVFEHAGLVMSTG
jgi:hypothetical protein